MLKHVICALIDRASIVDTCKHVYEAGCANSYEIDDPKYRCMPATHPEDFVHLIAYSFKHQSMQQRINITLSSVILIIYRMLQILHWQIRCIRFKCDHTMNTD